MQSRKPPLLVLTFFFFNDTATTEIYTLSLHDALPIFDQLPDPFGLKGIEAAVSRLQRALRSEEHTSELQSQSNLVCRLLLEKKKKQTKTLGSAKTALYTTTERT